LYIQKIKLLLLKCKNSLRLFGSDSISKKILLGTNVQIIGLDNIIIEDNCTIGENSLFTVNDRSDKRKQLLIGKNVYIGRDSFFSVGNSIQLCDYVIAGNKCSFICSDHNFNDPLIPYALTGNNYHKSIRIGVNCWLGHDVCILGEVSIGHGSIIGAKTIIVKDVPPFSMVVGNPGRVIKRYNFETKQWQPGKEIAQSKYMNETVYLNELNAKNLNLPLAHHSSSSKYGHL
jgi:acetyltransferase-like isoleucine patch superfamily enzyme